MADRHEHAAQRHFRPRAGADEPWSLAITVLTSDADAPPHIMPKRVLLAAESGIDLGIIELRKSLYPAPNHAWENWNNVPANGVVSYGISTIANAGLAGTPMTIESNVDAPNTLVDPVNGWQYYRIRTIGTMPLTGFARTTDNKQDGRLRKLSLRWERFTNGVLTAHSVSDAPQVCRRAEAIHLATVARWMP